MAEVEKSMGALVLHSTCRRVAIYLFADDLHASGRSIGFKVAGTSQRGTSYRVHQSPGPNTMWWIKDLDVLSRSTRCGGGEGDHHVTERQ